MSLTRHDWPVEAHVDDRNLHNAVRRLREKLGFALPPVEEEDDDNFGAIRKNGELGDWEKIGWLATKRMRTVMGLESM